MKGWRAVALCATCFLALGGTNAVAASELPYMTYTYTYTGEAAASPAAFTVDRVVMPGRTEGTEAAGALRTPRDLATDTRGNCYVADTGNDRIVVYDAEFRVLAIITETAGDDIPALPFKSPQGLFLAPGGELYVADTGNNRLVILDTLQGFKTVRVIDKIESPVLPDEFIFSPSAVAVDKNGRIYLVVMNNVMGIVALTPQGTFESFRGATRVVPKPIDLFWRRFMTREQLDRLPSYVPTEFNNVNIDADGFVYATTNSISAWDMYSAIQARSSASDYAPVRKLNPSGDDVMSRNGFFPPSGDVKIIYNTLNPQDGPSSIIDVALGPNDVYTLLDARRCRLFTYNANGDLLYAFGGQGYAAGSFETVTAVDYRGSDLLVLDEKNEYITVFRRTAYGDQVDNAIALYNSRKFQESAAAWSSLAAENNNLDLAYIGLGRSYFQEGRYREAMDFFRIANHTAEYSRALGKHREELMEGWLFPILFGVAALLAALSKLFQMARRRNRRLDYDTAQSVKCPNQLLYVLRYITHPFDAAGAIRRSGRAGVLSASILLLITLLFSGVNQLMSGFLFRSTENLAGFRPVDIVAVILIPVILFCTANWCLSSLMGGEARFKDIYIIVCYSLVPYTMALLPLTAISHFLTAEDAGMYRFIFTLATVWVGFLLFSGIAVVQNYSFVKNLLTLFLTVVGMAVIAFFAVLLVQLMQQVTGFIYNLYLEIYMRR